MMNTSCQKTPGYLYSRHVVAASEMALQQEAWSQDYVQLTPGPFAGSYMAVKLPDFQLYHESANQAMHQYGSASPSQFHFGIPLDAMASRSHFFGTLVKGSKLLCINPGDDFDYHSPCGMQFAGFSIETDRIRDLDTLYEFDQLPLTPVEITPYQRGHFYQLVSNVLHEASSGVVVLTHVEQQHQLVQQALDIVMGAIGHHIERPASTPQGRAQLVRQVRSYLFENLDEPMSVIDICRHFGISRRTLQYAFQDTLDVSPVKYLRALRLHGVRRELLNPPTSECRVQDVAARWGFWHLSHFAEEYKCLFGESPSHTLWSSLGLTA